MTVFALVLVGGVAWEMTRTAGTAQAAVAPAGMQPAATQNDPQSQAAPSYAITPQAAGQIALRLARGAVLQGDPQLVDLQGTPAYEVVLDRGTLYIDANSGRLLYAQATAGSALGRNSGRGGTFDNHSESGDHPFGGSDD